MSLFDMIDDIAERNIIKTETGDNRIFGIMVGDVVDNYDMERAGRVCVSIHTRDSESNVLKWARVAFPYIGSEWGMYFFPEVGDQVLVAFDGGNIERPYVIGCIPKDGDKFLKKSKHDKNKKKRIVTKNGNCIEITDGMNDDDLAASAQPPSVPSPTAGADALSGGVPGAGGGMDGDKIEIKTSDDKHVITIDDGKKLICIQDKDKNCSLEMKTMTGDINLTAANKLTIKVGDTIKVTMNGKSGKLLVEARDVVVDSTGKVEVSATGKAGLSGANINIESNSTLKLKANTLVSVEGKPIKLG